MPTKGDGRRADLIGQLETELASVHHISIYSTGYGPGGTHLVHYTASGSDDAHPAHVRMYRFDNPSF